MIKLLFTVFFVTVTSNTFAADITTFVVQEAKRSDESGWARTNAPVTVGISLPENGGYKNTSSFGLTGATAGQFKITGWWPNGNAQWVTVDLQTSLTAAQVKSGFALTNSGNGNFGGNDLATDGASAITVNTGAATFTIKKANFNVFDSVVVGSDTLVSSSNSGGFKVVDASSVAYSSVNDSSSAAFIEENGPLRAVIVSSGSLKTSGGTRFCDYEARLTFYKNKSYVKGIVSLRHARQADYKANKLFYGSEITVPLTVGTTKTVLLTTKDSEVTRSIGTSDTAYVYQGHSSHPWKVVYEAVGGEDGWEPPIPKTGDGYPWVLTPAWFGQEMVVGSETIQAKGSEGTWSQGYADLSDSAGKGVTVALKDMPQNYPAGFDISGGGDVSIELFSKRNNNTSLKFGWGKWETREVLWDFHNTSNDKSASFRVLQNPLIGRAPFEHYRVNKAFGTDQIASVAEQDAFWIAQGETARNLSDPTYSSDTATYPWRGFYRHWNRAVGGFANKSDTAGSDFMDWIRTGHAGFYVFAHQRAFSDGYTGVRRSDDFSTGFDDSSQPMKNGDNISGGSFDLEHHYIQAFPWLYFSTGNSYFKTAALEDAEYLYRHAISAYGIPGTEYLRAWSREAMPMAIYYDLARSVGDTSRSYLIDKLASATTYLIDSREDQANIPTKGKAYRGRNMDRGYIYWDTTLVSASQRALWSFFHVEIHFNAMWEIMRAMKKWGYSYSRMDDFEDFLMGLSQFQYNEHLKCESLDGVDVIYGGKCGVELSYRLYQTRAEVEASGEGDTEISPYAASRGYTWYYARTGDDKMNRAAMAATWTGDNPRIWSEMQDLALYYIYAHPIQPDVSIIPNVVNNGGGSYTLSWTVPSGVNKYKIKYSTKQIVDWLGYNRDTETYQYNPANYTAFFAATNISGEPDPSIAGSVQSITVTGLPTNGINFAVKGMVEIMGAPTQLQTGRRYRYNSITSNQN